MALISVLVDSGEEVLVVTLMAAVAAAADILVEGEAQILVTEVVAVLTIQGSIRTMSQG